MIGCVRPVQPVQVFFDFFLLLVSSNIYKVEKWLDTLDITNSSLFLPTALGKTMGGYNSGGHNAKGPGACEDFDHISIRLLKKQGILDAITPTPLRFNSGSWVWFQNIHNRLFKVDYTVSHAHEKSQAISHRIHLVAIPRHFGGEDRYLKCPTLDCAHKVRKLYIVGPHIACRHCLHLTYSSQRKRGINQLIAKMDRIKEQLEFDPMSWDMSLKRPQYMRKCEYNGLVKDLHALEIESYLLRNR
uniref:Uncharacterized protein n=1 Tax=Magnetococcus massalia (strain MO-1) TaxID=451514 RepID=A0A1S7LNG7_MAGMO|nr:Protein of unknown function [Candidatus Magnetococcus massalia]